MHLEHSGLTQHRESRQGRLRPECGQWLPQMPGIPEWKPRTVWALPEISPHWAAIRGTRTGVPRSVWRWRQALTLEAGHTARSCPAATTSVQATTSHPVSSVNGLHSGAREDAQSPGRRCPPCILPCLGLSGALQESVLKCPCWGRVRQPPGQRQALLGEGLGEGPLTLPHLHIRTRSRPSSQSWQPWPACLWPRTNRSPVSAGCQVSRGVPAAGAEPLH